MTAPSVPYTRVDQGDIDMASGLRTTLPATWADNGQHVREGIHDPDIHTDVLGHDHDDVNSSLVILPSGPNLICDGQPSTSGSNSVAYWHRTGARIGGGGVTNAGLYFTATGQYATHIIGGVDVHGNEWSSGASRRLFGAGADLCLAICARARAPMANLTMTFGLTDGHTSTFETGTACTITQDTVGVGRFRRFYGFLPLYSSAGHSTDVRLGIKTSGTFTSGGQIDVTLMWLKACNVLGWWEPGNAVIKHAGLRLIGVGSVSMWDQDLTYTSALHLVPA